MANLFKRYESESYPGQFHVVCEDDVETAGKYGWGHTLEEARQAWGELVVERVDDHIFDMRAAGQIDHLTADLCFTDIDGLAYLPF